MNEQMTFQQNIPYTACVFTGHRELGDDFSKKTLKKEVENLIKEGVTTFYTGMARGFDLIAGETILDLKKKYDVKLIACIPYYGQEKNFIEKDKKRYADVLKKCDEKVLLSESYYKGCLLARNRYMADRSDCMIAYLRKEEGGTAYTLNYFKRKRGGKIIIV